MNKIKEIMKKYSMKDLNGIGLIEAMRELELKEKIESRRKECMNCTNLINQEGDAFCSKCDELHRLDDDGNVQEL